MEKVDVVIIGAGVIGLACARALSQAGRKVWVLEKAAQIGTGASSRNSEVMHAGLYYAAGSLKSALCIRGRALLYEYCRQRHIAHQAIGKLLVATDATQEDLLDAIARHAIDHELNDIQRLTRSTAQLMEPGLACTYALLSPSTGIIDSHSYLLALQADAEAAGAQFAMHSGVVSGYTDDMVHLRIASDHAFDLQAALVVNCAGLHAVAMARMLLGDAATLPSAHWAKGHYFSLTGRAPFSRLIYPVPEPGGLGIHLTLDIDGQARFGPDVQWLADTKHEDYSFSNDDDARKAAFENAIRRYWPQLPDNSLIPSYTGIRSKLSGPGEAAADFSIQREGCVINCMGIESPGLTASLAIAEKVTELAQAV